MEDFMFELELLKQFEKEMQDQQDPAKVSKEESSPYQNAIQEAAGQLDALFQSIDNYLMAWEDDEENAQTPENPLA